MKKEFVCIVCPRGCHLIVDENMEVTGNACPRGKVYALSELTNPVRMITSSVRVLNRVDTLVSVKTSAPIPKGKIMEVMDVINALNVEAPTHINQIIKKNVLGLGIDILITKNID
jgi:CxxC motif-containing protein